MTGFSLRDVVMKLLGGGSVATVVFMACAVALISAQPGAGWQDPSPHQAQSVRVDQGVDLEVLDWGGSGPPLVLLAGLGNSAHVFDDFAPRLRAFGHVYGVTRRGFGRSSRPSSGYDAARLGQDVLAVLDRFALQRPVLIGHSIAGQELSYIGSFSPDRVAAVIYLDGGYDYAYWPTSAPRIPPAAPPGTPPPPQPSDVANYEAYRAWATRLTGYAVPEAEIRQFRVVSDTGAIGDRLGASSVQDQVMKGWMPFRNIKSPAFFIFASPHEAPSWMKQLPDQAQVAAFLRGDAETTERQASAIERDVPTAKVVRIANANHYVFLTQPDYVLQLIERFLLTLH